MNKAACWALACGLIAVSTTGCPPIVLPPNLSGNYTGTWSVAAESVRLGYTGCDISFALAEQAAGATASPSTVSGTVTLAFDCIPAAVSRNVEPLTLAVEGEVLSDGTLELRTPALAPDCGEPVCVEVVFAARGIDTNNDGVTDSLSGTWSGYISGTLIQRQFPFLNISNGIPVQGTVAAARQ